MIRRFAIVAVAAATLLSGAGVARGYSGFRHTSSTGIVRAESHGLVLSLFLPFPTPYPENALVKATVRLWNSTGHAIRVQEPRIDVLWPSGRAAYSIHYGQFSPGIVGLPAPFVAPRNPTPPVLVIPPGKAIAQHIFVILRTGRLRASAIDAPGTAAAGTVSTPVLTSRVNGKKYARITISKVNGAVSAVITPPRPHQGGTLWYMSAERCGSTTNVTTRWMRVPYADHEPDGSYVFPAPGCTNPAAWSLVAGWIGQSLGAGNYAG